MILLVLFNLNLIFLMKVHNISSNPPKAEHNDLIKCTYFKQISLGVCATKIAWVSDIVIEPRCIFLINEEIHCMIKVE